MRNSSKKERKVLLYLFTTQMESRGIEVDRLSFAFIIMRSSAIVVVTIILVLHTHAHSTNT